jgi:hypothetical protein
MSARLKASRCGAGKSWVARSFQASDRATALVAVVLLPLLAMAQAPAGTSSAAAGVAFDNVASQIGLAFQPINGASAEKYLAETMGSGGLFFDYDQDGWPDVFLVDGGSLADAQLNGRARHRLFHNRGPSAGSGQARFEDVTEQSGIQHREYGMGACAADYDNDGLVDLYVTGVGANTLYHNEGHGRFRDVTRSANVGASQWSTSCAFGDFDKDGFVDLFVTRYVETGMGNNKFCGDPARKLRVYCHPLNYQGLSNLVFHNSGNGTFTDASAQAGVSALRGNGLGVVVADYDDDGWPDVFVANDSVPNFLFHNEGRGVFKESALVAGVAVAIDGKPRAGMGTDFGDFDGDGRLDLVVTNHEFEGATLFRNLGKGLFTEATSQSGIGPPTLPLVGFGVALFDYDNDGRPDVAIVNGHVVDNTAIFRTGSSHAQRKLLFHNDGNRRFSDVGRASGPGFAGEAVGRTLAVADIDNDGDLDILVTDNGQPAEVLRNRDGNRLNAIGLRLVGTRSNRDAIGARVRVTSGAVTSVQEVKAGSSYLGQNDIVLHVGLGTANQADRVEIRWPSGRVDVLERLAANQIVTITEGSGITNRVPFKR